MFWSPILTGWNKFVLYSRRTQCSYAEWPASGRSSEEEVAEEEVAEETPLPTGSTDDDVMVETWRIEHETSDRKEKLLLTTLPLVKGTAGSTRVRGNDAVVVVVLVRSCWRGFARRNRNVCLSIPGSRRARTRMGNTSRRATRNTLLEPPGITRQKDRARTWSEAVPRRSNAE